MVRIDKWHAQRAPRNANIAQCPSGGDVTSEMNDETKHIFVMYLYYYQENSDARQFYKTTHCNTDCLPWIASIGQMDAR